MRLVGHFYFYENGIKDISYACAMFTVGGDIAICTIVCGRLKGTTTLYKTNVH